MPFNHLHYINPAQSNLELEQLPADEPARPVLIVGTKRGFEIASLVDARLGEVTYLHENNRNSYVVNNRVAWMVDREGNHITGVIGDLQGQPSRFYMDHMIFPLGDGVWGYGKTINNRVGQGLRPFGTPQREPGSATWGIQLQYRSDLKPVYESNVLYYPEYAFPAASWITNTFPRPEFSEDENRDRMALAEMMFKEQRAFYGLQVQSHRHGYGDDPRKFVTEAGINMPAPRFKQTVSGSVNIPRELTSAQRSSMYELGIDPATVTSRVAYSVTIDTESDAELYNQHLRVAQAIRRDNPSVPSNAAFSINDQNSFIVGINAN